MVRGLDIFQERFAAYVDQYVLIGGTAASLTMEEAGLEFRATKDLDIVLHVEALTPAFGEAFWKFVEDRGYKIRQASDTGKPIFYRFQKPADDRYPAMVELFARAPDGLQPAEGSQLTPIPLDEAVSSLSAILLDEVYYAFIMAGRREVDGLPWVGEDRLIPLKAIAWLELTAPERAGRQGGCQGRAQATQRCTAPFATPGARHTHSSRQKDRRRHDAVPCRRRCRHGHRPENAAARQRRRRRVGGPHRPSL
jgi:hypothetical protein